MPSPHDALFHQVFSVPEDAIGYLIDILPHSLANRLEWATLERYPATFKGVGVGGAHADLVHRLRVDGADRHVYLLLEHKSHPEPLIALQVHRYVLRLIEQVRKDEAEVDGLALVVPIVVYHGLRAWDGGPPMPELFRCPPAVAGGMARFLPEVRFVFHDVSAARGAPIEGSGRITAYARIALEALRHAPTDEDPRAFFRRLRPLIHALSLVDGTGEKLASIYTYLAHVRGLSRQRMAAIIREELGPEQERRMRSTYDQIYEEGQSKGLRRGREQGREEGMAVGVTAGLRDALRTLLTTRFGTIPAPVTAALDGASADALRDAVALAAQVGGCEDLLLVLGGNRTDGDHPGAR